MGKNSNNKQKKNNKQTPVVVPENFDYQKFADAMFEAQKRAKDAEIKDADAKKQEKLKEWHKILRYKEYPESKHKIVNWFHKARNGIVVFYSLMTIKRKDAILDVATNSLLHLALDAILAIIKLGLYLVAACFAIASIYSLQQKAIVPFNIAYLCYSIISFMFARIVRLAQFEVDKISDKEYLLGLLSAITSFVAMVLAVIALFISKNN